MPLVFEIGIGTVESVPLYHYNPGGAAVRARLAGPRPWFDCDPEEFDVCVFARPELQEPVDIPWRDLVGLARSSGAEVLVVEGFRGSGLGEAAEEARRHGIGLVPRLLPGAPLEEAIRLGDAIVYDYPLDYIEDPLVRVEAVEAIRRLAEAPVWAEVNVYVREPVLAKLSPVLEAASTPGVALHVHIKHHAGGMAITRLVERARRRGVLIYVHNDLYPHEDTVCPRCGSIVAMRDNNALIRLEAPGGRCWKCGAPIPLYGRVRDKTPEGLLAATGGVRWLSPLLVRRIRSSLGLT